MSCFTDNPLSTALTSSDKNRAFILFMMLPGIRLTRGLIPLVNDNHVDNYLKEILAFVYYCSIVYNRPKNGCV